MGGFQHVLHHRQGIGAGVIQAGEVDQRVGDLAAHQIFENIQHPAAVGQAQHLAHRVGRDHVAFTMRDGLVQQRQGIARRAFGGTRDQRQGAVLDGDIFLLRQGGEIGGQLGAVDAAQVETLAARQNRHRNLADFRGGEDEFHMRRRLFQGLEQAVEGLLGQHVHLVDDIDLVARRDGGIAHALDDFADIVDAGARRGVHLLHVHVAGFGN